MSAIRVFIHEHLRTLLEDDELAALRIDFISYKELGKLPATFGRDSIYNHPNGLPIVKSEELAHIHLADSVTVWKNNTLQFNRTSDSHLIYCQGYTELNCYLLMAIFAPNAHEQARNNSIMHSLGKMAELFRQKY